MSIGGSHDDERGRAATPPISGNDGDASTRFSVRQKVIGGILGVGVILGIGAGIAAANPATTPSDENLEIAEPKETSSPTAPVTESTPEVNAVPATVFTVNYDLFESWDSLDRAARFAACNDFYDSNGFSTSLVLSSSNTGPEILEWFTARHDLAWELNKDKSNPGNGDVALKLVECMTSVQGDTDRSTRNLFEISFPFVRSTSFDLQPDTITRITRYSDTIATTASVSGLYQYKTVEYAWENGINGDIVQEIFEWTDDGTWQSVAQFSAETPVLYGSQPIVLDTTRANAPW